MYRYIYIFNFGKIHAFCLFPLPLVHSYLRSIAYREFCHLVYGFLGKKRIRLPACAYTKIRKEFPTSEEEKFTGFDLDEEN